jgi:hypothetical protein
VVSIFFPNNLVQAVGHREKIKPTNLKEAPVSENNPFHSQRQAKKFARKKWAKKVQPALLLVPSPEGPSLANNIFLLEGNFLKPGNSYCGPTGQPIGHRGIKIQLP